MPEPYCTCDPDRTIGDVCNCDQLNEDRDRYTHMYEYKALITRVIDGDTLEATIDLGFNVFTDRTLRLHGIDTPEIKGPSRSSGLTAKNAVISWLNLGQPPNYADVGRWPVIVRTHKNEHDSFRRWLAIVRQPGNDIPLNNYLLVNKFAQPYLP